MLDQDKKDKLRVGRTNSEKSELTQEEWNLLTWYREMSEVDQGYFQRVAMALAYALRA